MEPVGRIGSRDNLFAGGGENGRHNMLSALPPPPMPLGIPSFSTLTASDFRNAAPYGHLAPLAKKPPEAQPPESARESTPQPEPQKRTVQTYRKRQHDPSAAPGSYHDFGAGHVHGMLAHPPGDVPNLPPRSGTGMRLRPPRLSPCCCIPPPYPEPLVPVDEQLPAVLRLHDQRRIVNPGAVANALVYDCIERPPAVQQQQQPAQEPAPTAGSELQDVGTAGDAAGTEGEDVGGDGRGSRGSRAGRGSGPGDGELRLPQGSGGDGGGDGAAGGRGGSRTSGGGEQLRGGSASVGAGAGEAQAAVEGQQQPHAPQAARAAPCARTAQHDYFPDMPAWYSVRGPDDRTLVFESRFESGNLRRAIQVYPYEYDLILRPDINTRGHTQWFFFALSNTRAGCRYKLNLINLLKEDSLYNNGMQPLVHSARAQVGRGLGWHRAGSQVCYYANSIRRGRASAAHGQGGKTYYTLTFTLEAEYDNDLLHVAHCYPYTYTDLQRYIRAVELDPLRRHRMRREALATSLAGNTVDVLTITSPMQPAPASSSSSASANGPSYSSSGAGAYGPGPGLVGPGGAPGEDPDPAKRKKAVVISARVHPGESNASWMMKGLLDFLLGPSLDAKVLRDAFVFKIIPMLNPDGVITGNYRCSLAGVDLNRVWNDPSRKLHPVVHATKAFLRQLTEEREVALFCDLHGHSRKLDVFMYGCEKKVPKDTLPAYPGWPVPGSAGGQTNIPYRFQEKLLPLLIHHNAPDLFSYRHCSFKVQKSKSGTGRVVGFRELGLVNSFTLEASFAGASQGRWARQHFSTMHLEQQGAALLTALLDYWDPDQYGYTDLLAQLDFLHPANGEAPPRFITTPDGQLVEVEDDDVPTDSDDESSDDGGGAARGRARTARGARTASLPATAGVQSGPLSRDPQGAAFMQQYYSAYGVGPGGAGGGPQGRLLRAGDGDPKVHSDSEVVLDPKKARRRARAALQKALLRAERAKADEGLAACLPLMAALQGPGADAGAAAGAGAGGGSGSESGGFHLVTAAQRNSSSNTPTGRPPAAAAPRAIEYAKQRGVYRGETPQWTVPGLYTPPYDPTDLASLSTPASPQRAAASSPGPGPPSGAVRSHSTSTAQGPGGPTTAAAALAASTNTFSALLHAPNNPASQALANPGATGRPVPSPAPLPSSGAAAARPPLPSSLASPPIAGSGSSHQQPQFSRQPQPSFAQPLPRGGSQYAFAPFGGSSAAAAAAAAAANRESSNGLTHPALDRPPSTSGPRTLTPIPGLLRPYSSASSRPAPMQPQQRAPSPQPTQPQQHRISSENVLAAAANAAASNRSKRASMTPRVSGEPGPGGGEEGLGGGEDGDGLLGMGMDSPAAIRAAAAQMYADPGRLRKERETLEAQVAETLLTGSPLFQRL